MFSFVVSNRFVPERTVDSLLAIEIVRSNPDTLIWSPTNHEDSADHIMYTPGAAGFVFECKAVTRSSGTAPWRAEIDAVQLNTYCTVRPNVLYVVLARPQDEKAPWDRNCDCHFCLGACRMCQTDVRSRAVVDVGVRSAPIELRLQPWFAHWAFLVPAKDLRSLLRGQPTLLLDDAALARGPFTRLCHFFRLVDSGAIAPIPLSEFQLDNYPSLWANDPENDDTTPPLVALTRVTGI